VAVETEEAEDDGDMAAALETTEEVEDAGDRVAEVLLAEWVRCSCSLVPPDDNLADGAGDEETTTDAEMEDRSLFNLCLGVNAEAMPYPPEDEDKAELPSLVDGNSIVASDDPQSR
jgi:hypothetical protein